MDTSAASAEPRLNDPSAPRLVAPPATIGGDARLFDGRASGSRGRVVDEDATSLVAACEAALAGRSIDAAALRPRGDVTLNSVERFLHHHSAATLALQSARGHLYDALRAIEFGDRHVLGQFVDVSRMVDASATVAVAVAEFGLAAIARGRWTLGLDAVGQALRYDAIAGDGTLAADVARCGMIADRYELAARTLGRQPPRLNVAPSPVVTVAILCSGIEDDAATARLLEARALRRGPDEATRLRVYCTEAFTAPPAHAPQLVTTSAGSLRDGASTLERLRSAGIDVWFAPVGADAVQKSRMLVERLVRDRVDVLLIDASLADAAAWTCVACRPVPKQIALLRRSQAAGFAGVDAAIDLDAPLRWLDADVWADRGIAVQSIAQGVDVERTQRAVDRRAYGIADDAIVLATLSRDPSRTLTPAFAQMVARALAEIPRSVYLIVGPGPCDVQRRIFEQAGVGRRVGYAGRRRDVAAFLAMSDVYVAESPQSDREGVITAMALAKPVAILGGPEHDRPAHARLVGHAHAVNGGGLDALLDRVLRLARDPAYRTNVGHTLATRAAEQFAMGQTLAALDEIALGIPAAQTLADPIVKVA